MVSLDHTGSFNQMYSSTNLPSLAAGSGNIFRVRWMNGAYPRAASNCSREISTDCELYNGGCLCTTRTHSIAGFTDTQSMPSQGEVEERLRIGSMPPVHYDAGTYSRCTTTACNATSDVQLYTRGTADAPLLDESAIFRVVANGSRIMHLANMVSTVQIANGTFTFRNAPSFLSLQRPTLRDAEYESEAVLEHLLHHANTPPFVVTRLIQNLVTSNPSPRFVRAAATAFQTGVHDGRTFSGRYGDLAATTAAILLDREARSLVVQHDPSFGSYRDPLQKLYHAMRALSFVSSDGREVQFDRSSLAKMGMAAHRSPTVFNFFHPAFQPAGAASEAQLWAPATEIGTMPHVVGFQSAMTALIREGFRGCRSGLGDGQTHCDWTAPEGRLMFTPHNASSVTDTIDELDLLLTGGRLGTLSRQVLSDKYAAALEQDGPVEAFRVAEQLIVATAEFHTNAHASTRPKPVKAVPQQASLGRPYKAIIMLYFDGGVDSFSMVVPHSGCAAAATSYEQYRQTRGGAALARDTLLPILVPNHSQPCTTYGLHPSLPFVRELYDVGEAIITANVGNLVEPIESNTQYHQRRLPRSLFSHEHQKKQARTLHPQLTTANGVLGRMVDALVSTNTTALDAPAPYKSAAYSISGSTDALRGDACSVFTLSKDQGAVEFYQPQRSLAAAQGGVRDEYRRYELGGASLDALLELTANESGSVFAETSNTLLRSSLISSEHLGAALANITGLLTQDWVALFASNDGVLLRQLYQVARLVSARGVLQAERDVFFVDVGGFDHHGVNSRDFADMLAKVDTSLRVFVGEMRAQGVWEQLAIVTSSEFARTLVFNGLGTDHAWGGNQFVMGGRVIGGRMNGRYPSLDLTSEMVVDQRRGSLIPTTPWEGLYRPLAQWFGVREERMHEVLPNLHNFPNEMVPTVDELFRPRGHE
jgi:cullin-associated NEDD8-dissociated protein 1